MSFFIRFSFAVIFVVFEGGNRDVKRLPKYSKFEYKIDSNFFYFLKNNKTMKKKYQKPIIIIQNDLKYSKLKTEVCAWWLYIYILWEYIRTTSETICFGLFILLDYYYCCSNSNSILSEATAATPLQSSYILLLASYQFWWLYVQKWTINHRNDSSIYIYSDWFVTFVIILIS